MQQKVFVSWSGGKDSYLALQKAVAGGLAVTTLVTFTNKEGRSMSHGVDTAVLINQARALGFPLETEKVSWEEYENGFVNVVTRLKEQGVTGGVFGDINLTEHRQWVESRCSRQSIDAFLPLWGMSETDVVEELLNRRARLLIVALRSDLLGKEWIGRELDRHFLEECLAKNISPCGEHGEYHTLAVGGPLFKEPLQYQLGEVYRKDNLLYQEVHLNNL